MHLHGKAMGIQAKTTDVVNAVAGGGARTMVGRTYINSIGAMVDGCDSTFQIFGRSQEFEGMHEICHSISLMLYGVSW